MGNAHWMVCVMGWGSVQVKANVLVLVDHKKIHIITLIKLLLKLNVQKIKTLIITLRIITVMLKEYAKMDCVQGNKGDH